MIAVIIIRRKIRDVSNVEKVRLAISPKKKAEMEEEIRKRQKKTESHIKMHMLQAARDVLALSCDETIPVKYGEHTHHWFHIPSP